ncbi:baculoviral IAP repeat-containing protein 7-like [Ptychodera flava]|uniref:baculoviral IAP repeat-containing protein 7-like n=1 Tax=Ptychodera flava TaxID=63121 RepID=UPI00396A1FBB
MNQAYIMAVGLHREADRLATYVSWCLSRSARVTPIAMAKAGLYCTGKEDTTKCFSCGGRISHEDLTGPVMEIHKRQYPHCDFVNGKDTNNIPLGSVDKRTEESAKKISEYEEPNNKQTNGSGNNGKKKKKKKNKNKRITNDKEDYKRETSNEDDDDKENYSLIYDIENDPKYQEANRVLKSEYKRLLTFIYWPRNAPVMPEDLAKAGFYYAGTEDKVQCFCCSGVLKNWRQGDIPIDEHRYYFPSCDFVRGEDVGNEPMRPTTSKQSVINIGPSDRRRPRDHNKAEFIGRKHSENDTVVGAHAQSESSPGAQKPKHPNFVEEAARLGSYDSWKGCVSQEFLAKAGFFFTGIEDNVRCFHCDGALRNWEPTDEPWIEHARWFPKCQFLLKHRGSAFMKYVADKYPKPCAQNDPQKTDHRNGARSRKTFVAQQVNDFMRTDTAQVVLDMGYSKDMVKSVVRKHVKRNRECYKSTHDLLIAVWDLEKKLSAAGKSSLDDDDDDDDDDADDNTGEKDEQLLGAVGGVSSITIDQYGSSSFESGLSSQKEMLDELEELKQKKTCKICMDSDVCMLFQPCGHLVTCDVCSSQLRQCPFCRTTIRSAVRAYMA